MGVALESIPVAHTPPGGWTEMPAPVLAGCEEPIVAGAPDLRGTWEVVHVDDPEGREVPDSPMLGLVQRIEQAGNRAVMMCKGVVHDMICDGTVEHGINDVFEFDRKTPLVVRASYEDGVHVLRPEGLDGVEVRRWMEGEQLIWTYIGHRAISTRREDA